MFAATDRPKITKLPLLIPLITIGADFRSFTNLGTIRENNKKHINIPARLKQISLI
jgi:hypothetical protein